MVAQLLTVRNCEFGKSCSVGGYSINGKEPRSGEQCFDWCHTPLGSNDGFKSGRSSWWNPWSKVQRERCLQEVEEESLRRWIANRHWSWKVWRQDLGVLGDEAGEMVEKLMTDEFTRAKVINEGGPCFDIDEMDRSY